MNRESGVGSKEQGIEKVEKAKIFTMRYVRLIPALPLLTLFTGISGKDVDP